MKILITGVAGFIGFHLSRKLLLSKCKVFGIDNLNKYYDINLKKNRINELKKYSNFFFYKIDLLNSDKINRIVQINKIKYIIHLAAQAGVRYSVQSPDIYFKSNIEGFFKILEVSRKNKIKHLIFASSSSVYGNNNKFPLYEYMNTDKPLSFYASSKKTNEVMAYSYANIYKLPVTALRFFTVYGEFCRPDMALYKFTNAIINKKTVNIYNKGNHFRDFTHIDDIVVGIEGLIKFPSNNSIPYECFNIGSAKTKKITTFLKIIEKNLNKKAKIKNLPYQIGDIYKTQANLDKLYRKIRYIPKIKIKVGIKSYINWFVKYYRNNK